ncbi:MAG: hypothetical protein PHD46_06445 [Eubacteriales bacterium]|mgnify:FL=1|jgi:hypothetical protein|nr:hypothetical protein [Eubacteriales bacterium]HBT65305.1 hypothetical protein [Oscillospiraceae bacterium]
MAGQNEESADPRLSDVELSTKLRALFVKFRVRRIFIAHCFILACIFAISELLFQNEYLF